jgi:hypothetical protein
VKASTRLGELGSRLLPLTSQVPYFCPHVLPAWLHPVWDFLRAWTVCSRTGVCLEPGRHSVNFAEGLKAACESYLC